MFISETNPSENLISILNENLEIEKISRENVYLLCLTATLLLERGSIEIGRVKKAVTHLGHYHIGPHSFGPNFLGFSFICDIL